VFVNPATKEPYVEMKTAFSVATKKANLGHVHFHDLRRSFVTNARRAGQPEGVVQRISGHKTRSVFARYNIIDESDLTAAMAALDAKREQR
jgi:integrase